MLCLSQRIGARIAATTITHGLSVAVIIQKLLGFGALISILPMDRMVVAIVLTILFLLITVEDMAIAVAIAVALHIKVTLLIHVRAIIGIKPVRANL
jgi:hypothetical protein